jgi:hypothetical protein
VKPKNIAYLSLKEGDYTYQQLADLAQEALKKEAEEISEQVNPITKTGILKNDLFQFYTNYCYDMTDGLFVILTEQEFDDSLVMKVVIEAGTKFVRRKRGVWMPEIAVPGFEELSFNDTWAETNITDVKKFVKPRKKL